jgi:hypothetical protein
MSIASYEDDELEKVFRAILKAPVWDASLLQAFKHFLTERTRFDVIQTRIAGTYPRISS